MLDYIKDDLSHTLKHLADYPLSYEQYTDDLGLYLSNILNLLGSDDPEWQYSTIKFCEFASAREFLAHLAKLESLKKQISAEYDLRSEPIERARLERLLDSVRACREELDWGGDWSEDEWMLVHYWSEIDAPAARRDEA